MSNDRHVLQPGDPAPEFKLPAVNREGVVSLAEYREKGSVLVALFRGLHCPFCRRQIASLAATREKLAREGVETLAVVNTPAQRARQYFQYRPTPVVLAADPDVQTHLAFGLGETEVLPDDTDPHLLHWPQSATMAQFLNTAVTADGELPQPMNVFAASQALNEKDHFEMTEGDQFSASAHPTIAIGQFLVDSGGTIRWTFVEMPDGPHQVGRLPNVDEIVAAARAARHH
jgi:peroxiredoxin